MHGDFTYLLNVIDMKTFGHNPNEIIELINSLVSHHKLVELKCLAGLIKLFKLSKLIVKYPIGLIVRIISLAGHNGLVGVIGIVGHSGIIGIIGLDGIIGLINCNIGLSDCNDVVDHMASSAATILPITLASSSSDTMTSSASLASASLAS